MSNENMIRDDNNHPDRPAHWADHDPTNTYYRKGMEVYVERMGESEPIFVCRCDTVSWANYVINCLTMPEMM